jgi:transcription initiation factor IIE alpha subunit
MGFFSQLAIDVEEMLFEGATEQEIAQKLNISVEQVRECILQLEEADVSYEIDYEDDGDALASAGFGTDEDYGYSGDDY